MDFVLDSLGCRPNNPSFSCGFGGVGCIPAWRFAFLFDSLGNLSARQARCMGWWELVESCLALECMALAVSLRQLFRFHFLRLFCILVGKKVLSPARIVGQVACFRRENVKLKALTVDY